MVDVSAQAWLKLDGRRESEEVDLILNQVASVDSITPDRPSSSISRSRTPPSGDSHTERLRCKISGLELQLREQRQINSMMRSGEEELEGIMNEMKKRWLEEQELAEEAEAQVEVEQKRANEAEARCANMDKSLMESAAIRVEAELRSASAEKRASEAEEKLKEGLKEVEERERKMLEVESFAEEKVRELTAELERVKASSLENEKKVEELRKEKDEEEERMKASFKVEVEEVRKSLTARILHLSLQLCSLEEAHAFNGAEKEESQKTTTGTVAYCRRYKSNTPSSKGSMENLLACHNEPPRPPLEDVANSPHRMIYNGVMRPRGETF